LNYRLASLWLVSGQYREAFELLEVLKKEVDFPYRAQVYNKSGVARYYQDMLYKALDDFKTALRIDSKYAEAKFNLKSLNLKLEHFNAGRVYLKMRRYREAEAEFEKAIKQSPNFVMAHHFLGLGYAYQSKWDKAIEEYEIVTALAPHYQHIHQVYNLLGNAYINLAKDFKEDAKNTHLKKGIAKFKTALSLKPEFIEARRNLKNIYQTVNLASLMGISRQEAGNEYLNIKLFSKALEEFDKVFEKDPRNKLARQKKIEAIVGWTKLNCCESRDYERVITLCQRFLPDIKDQNARDNLTLLMGYAYMQKGEAWYDKAIEELKKIPTDPQSNYYLGLIYFNQGHLTDALNEFQQAKRADMNNPEYFFMLAKLHFYLKNFTLTKGLFQKALEKLRLQTDRNRVDSIRFSYLCQRKEIYEQDLAFVQKGPDKEGVLPSDKESIGLLINSDNLDRKGQKGVYRYIKHYLEKETGFAVVDYKRYENLIAEKLIPESCTKEDCFDEYSWLTDTAKLLLVDLDQWAEQVLVSFSLYQPETKYKESIHQQEFQGVELYKSLKQSLEGVTAFFKTQRTRVYCELCPEM
jgi:tetratricopeptide (TPR) repeat protein